MGSSVTKFLVSLALLVQTMPAGACCLPASNAQAVSAPSVAEDGLAEKPSAACCRHQGKATMAQKGLVETPAPRTAQHCALPTERVPVSPSFTCCCTQRVATPESQVRIPES